MFVKLKGIDRYEFAVMNDRLVVRNLKGRVIAPRAHTNGKRH